MNQMNPYQINPYMYPYNYGYMPYTTPTTPIMQTPASTASTTTNTTSNLKLDTVSGKTAADVYVVNPGEEAVLIDIDNPCIYKKVRSMDGKLESATYDLTLHVDQPENTAPQVDLTGYVTQEAIEQIVEDRVKAEVEKRLSELSFTPTPTRTRKTKVVEVDD